jgi:GNAT superfamily N-acetyltransferase
LENSLYNIRPATVGDALSLAHHRTQMWLDMGSLSPGATPMMLETSTEYFKEAVASKEYIGWLVEVEGVGIVAGGGLTLRNTPPLPDKNKQTVPTSLTAHIFNVFVEKPHRKRGLARLIMQTIGDWCTKNGVRTLTLNASDEGRPLYQSMGYEEVKNFMRLINPQL